MSEWKEVKLGDIAEKLTSGGTPSTKVGEYYNGDIPWLNTKEVNFNRIWRTEKLISEKGLQNSSAKWIKENSVIVAMYGATAAKVALNKIPLTTNQACCNIIIDNSKANYEFVFYSIWSKYNELENIAVGAAQQNLSVSVISDFDIYLPTLPEKRAIAGVLSSLDDKIDLLHRQNETLEKMAETLFRQWFVEEAEEGWEEGKLGNILTVKGGATPSTKNPGYWNGNINWTSPRDITTLNSIFLFDTERKITKEGLSKISSGLLPKGTLLMSSRAPVGVLAFSEIPIAINQGYIAILDNKGYSKEFIYLWLKTNMNYVRSYANGSTFLEISKTSFKSLDVQIPPKKIIDKFQKLIGPIFNKIKQNQIQIRTLTALRDTLLPKLMNGEVRVEMDTVKTHGRASQREDQQEKASQREDNLDQQSKNNEKIQK